MAAKRDEPDVSTPSRAHEAMSPKWMKIDTLLAGTEAMRAAGELYLPRYEEESAQRYSVRLNMTTLLNLTKFTLSNLVGRVFKNPIQFNQDVPEVIRGVVEEAGKKQVAKEKAEGLIENIDGQGDHVQVVAYRWFEQGFAKGLSHMLIDMPPAPVRADGLKPTLADTADRKPYWVPIAPENLLFAYARTVDGKQVLEMVRILEEYSYLDKFNEVCGVQVRVLRPGSWEIWRYIEDKRGDKDWYVHDAGVMDVKDKDGRQYIPLVTFYTKKKGLMLSDVPLDDLADLNIEHWQSKSDQRNVLTAARFPILAVSGSTGEDDATGKKINIGPYQLLSTPDPNGKYYYVEHTGAAISAGRQDLRDLEDQMASYGAQFLKKKADIESATARILDSTETISELQAIALNFKDALEQALKITADWLSLPSGGSVTIDAGLSISLDGTDLQTLTEARKNRDISRQTYLGEMKRRDVLSDDFDPALNDEQLLEENDLGLMGGDPSVNPRKIKKSDNNNPAGGQ